jgi:hypothetical protein
MGIDPRTVDKGIFIVPMEAFKKDNCFYAYQIGHNRRSENYNNTWTDAYNFPDNSYQNFYFTAPANNGDLYFLLDTYTYQ